MKEPPIPEFKHDVQTLLAFFEEAQQQTQKRADVRRMRTI